MIKRRHRPFFDLARDYNAALMGPIPLQQLLAAVNKRELCTRLDALLRHVSDMTEGYRLQKAQWEREIRAYSHTFDMLTSREVFLLEQLHSALSDRGKALSRAHDDGERLSKESLNRELAEEIRFPQDPMQNLIGTAQLPDLSPDKWYSTMAHLVEYVDKKVQDLIGLKA